MAKATTSKWIKFFKNKYVITLIVFLAIVIVLSNNNVFVIHRLKRDVRALEREEEVIRESITADSIECFRLQDDLEAIERYGRENYYMKRANEDIFVVEDTPEE